MREICSYGSVGERGGNKPLYLEHKSLIFSPFDGSPRDQAKGQAKSGKSIGFKQTNLIN